MRSTHALHLPVVLQEGTLISRPTPLCLLCLPESRSVPFRSRPSRSRTRHFDAVWSGLADGPELPPPFPNAGQRFPQLLVRDVEVPQCRCDVGMAGAISTEFALSRARSRHSGGKG